MMTVPGHQSGKTRSEKEEPQKGGPSVAQGSSGGCQSVFPALEKRSHVPARTEADFTHGLLMRNGSCGTRPLQTELCSRRSQSRPVHPRPHSPAVTDCAAPSRQGHITEHTPTLPPLPGLPTPTPYHLPDALWRAAPGEAYSLLLPGTTNAVRGLTQVDREGPWPFLDRKGPK